MDSPGGMTLLISPEVRARLEERRLTEDNLQKTIARAEETGQKFVHSKTGRYLAGVRPYFATFWVEYSPREGGFEVHTAYQHRVKVTAGEG